MTTIAYHHASREVAVDGRVTSGALVATNNFEKWRLSGEDVWFLSGAIPDWDRFISHQTGILKGRPDFEVCCSALLVSGGKCYEAGMTEAGEPWRSVLTYDLAIGSGRDFAIAAMDHGKGARDSVGYASVRDNGTGGKISVFSIESMSFIGGDNV